MHGKLFLDLMHKSNLSTEGILISKKEEQLLKLESLQMKNTN